MSKLLEHAREELKYAGFDIEAPDKKKFDTDDDYTNACAKSAYRMLETFCKDEHSGMSAEITLALFDKLVRWENLTPLSNNPDEWNDTSEYEGKPKGTCFQSKRNSSCFSNDGLKTYYDIDAEENRIYELDENGKRTGWSSGVPVEQRVHHELKPRGEK